MSKKLLIATLSLKLTCSASATASTPENMNIENRVDVSMNVQKLLQEYIEDHGTPGAAVALIDHGKTQFFYAGKMALDGQKVTEDTLFEIGSITKVFTTLALMDRVEKGEMRLDDPIEKYLPEVKMPELDGKKITLKTLATHTSGIPRVPDNFDPKDPANPYQDYTVERLYSYLQSCTLRKGPGDSFEYSNAGMGLLGHILSTSSGKSYEELIQSLIAEPLNMPNTSIAVPDEAAINFAKGYHLEQAVSHWDIAPALAGAGALRSNIKDMANFLAANMGMLKSPLNSTLQKCHEKQFSPLPTFSVGLGWLVSNSNDTDIIGHNGGTGGFRSYLGFNPKTQKGIVILTNSTEDWPDEFGLLMLDPHYQRPQVDKALANDAEYLNRFTGAYDAALSDELPKQQLQISVFGKLLVSALSGGEVGMLYPESYGVFGVKGFPDAEVHFSFDDAGNVSHVEAHLISTGAILWKATPISDQSKESL